MGLSQSCGQTRGTGESPQIPQVCLKFLKIWGAPTKDFSVAYCPKLDIIIYIILTLFIGDPVYNNKTRPVSPRAKLEHAINLAKTGHKAEACEMLRSIVALQPVNQAQEHVQGAMLAIN